MYFKIAKNNVEKSFKNYSIYFLTLMFAVCIFYSFNSITAQEAMFILETRKAEYIEVLGQLISMVSVFVSFVLGGLILYGNNFLVKKRKKELGIYMTLGMAKRKIAGILFTETLLVGTIALGVGLLLGMIGSQGLSLLTAQLFEVDMTQYTFVVSYDAVQKTIKYFVLIFGVVMLFNTFQISKYELIDLLYAERKNEGFTKGSTKGDMALFGLSVLMLGLSYYLVLKVGLGADYRIFWLIIDFGCVGTFLYFKSLMSFLGGVAKYYPSFYLRRLNSFILRQMQSKVNTNVMAMTMICLMLFMTITGLSTGLSFKRVLEKSVRDTTPYDASVVIYGYDPDTDQTIIEIMKKYQVGFEGSEDYSLYYEYEVGNMGKVFGESNIEVLQDYKSFKINAIPLSSYNELRHLIGEQEEILGDHEVILTSNQQKLIKGFNSFLETGKMIQINDEAYEVKDQTVYQVSLVTSGLNDNFITLVVPDHMVEGKRPVKMVMNIEYDQENPERSEEKFAQLFKGYKDGMYKGKEVTYEDGFISGITRRQAYEETSGMTAVILFIGIYLGIIFLIASAAVLALQQLSEATESGARYGVLRKTGTPGYMINRSIFVQTLLYFALPLSLAFGHALVGINVANKFIIMYGKPSLMGGAVGTLGLLVVIYGGYFYVTYIGYKNAIEDQRL